jgi:hypothetical protein
MAIGETGTLSENTTYEGEPISVTFTEPLTNPVVALTATNYGGNKFSLRVIEFQTDENGDATGFTFTIDEWENHDGAHPAVEDINWIAIESGTHVLPDGRLIEAGYAQADSDGEDVTLAHDFPDTPVVLTTVASDTHAGHVDSDPTAITAGGFTLSVEEAERLDGIHGLEKVGWIAVQAGGDGSSGTASNADSVGSGWQTLDLGASFKAPVVLAETQTKNEADTGNVIFRNLGPDRIDLRFEEDTSADSETAHVPETVALVAFETGMILCFTAGTRIDTPYGPRKVEDLRAGDAVVTLDHGAKPCSGPAAATMARPSSPTATGCDRSDPEGRLRPRPARARHAGLAATPPAGTGLARPAAFRLPRVAGPGQGAVRRRAGRRASALHPPPFRAARDRHGQRHADGKLPSRPDVQIRAVRPAREEVFTLFPALRTAPEAWGPAARPGLTVREAALLAQPGEGDPQPPGAPHPFIFPKIRIPDTGLPSLPEIG